MNESVNNKKNTSIKRVGGTRDVKHTSRGRRHMGGLKERISRRVKSSGLYKKGKEVYEKAKGRYDKMDDGTKAAIKEYAKKGYESYKKKREKSNRIEQVRKEWKDRSNSK